LGNCGWSYFYDTTVIVNPKTGNIITVYPTNTQRVNSILKTMKIKVVLTGREYKYLVNILLKEHKEILAQIVFSEDSNNSINVELEDGVADDISELAGDEVGLHFDENYEPTEEGWILEHFIDRLPLAPICNWSA
jgi:mRNA degradation ribonuclease J1/J2